MSKAVHIFLSMTMTSTLAPRLLPKPQSTAMAVSVQKTPTPAGAEPYASEWEYLDDWFALVKGPLEPKPEKEDVQPVPAKAVEKLMSRTDATLRARVQLPFETYVRENKFDMTDRGLLLALLYDSLNPISGGGLTVAQLFAVCDARLMAERADILSRLEESGTLRTLALIECDVDMMPASRLYRLARGCRDLLVSRPAPREADIAFDSDLLDRVDLAVARLIQRITCSFDPNGAHWCGPARSGPGWSKYTAQARGVLLAVEELRQRGSGPAAAALREMDLSPEEEALFVALLCDARHLGDGFHVGFLLSFVERCVGAAPDWEELGGPDSRLFRKGLLEAKGTGPLFQRYARLRDDAAERLLPGMSCTTSEKTKSNEEALKPYDRIEPKTKLVNAVLPPDLFQELTEALLAVRAQGGLLECWGIHQASHEGDGFILLFEGPPGTGKTYTAEAVAHSLGRPLFRARLDQVFSKWVGETEKGIAALFRHAEREKAVVLLDEADALLGARDNASQRWEITPINVLLQELERFPGVAILTTNRPHALDPALERRLAARLTFTPPGPKERERLWRVHLPSRAMVAHDIEFAALGERYRLSGSQIRAACVRAARAAFRRSGKDRVIQQDDLEAAARKVTRKETGPVLGFCAPTLARKEITR